MGKDDEIGMEDVFVNFKNLEGWTHPTMGTTLQETVIDTALAIGGQRAWAVQELEPFFSIEQLQGELLKDAGLDDMNCLQVGVGRPGLTMRDPGYAPVPGMLHRWDLSFGWCLTSQGAAVWFMEQPRVWRPATAVPYARNKMSIYVSMVADKETLRAMPHSARVSFTYIPVTDKLYREINERWALD